MRRFARFACIDWSGARGEQLKGLALATCAAGDTAPALAVPTDPRGWSRTDLLEWLRVQADDGADMLIGIDFSAALPFADAGAYFPGLAGSPANARALWAQVDTACPDDPHLAATSYVRDPARAAYFRVGGLTGARFACPHGNGRTRIVEREGASGRPVSSFNLVGPAQVGLSSLTGMRVLHRLGGRVPVWPFDPVPARGPLIVEVYTSIAARAAGRPPGRSKMRTMAALDAAVATLGSTTIVGEGAIDDHASDALLTAAWLRRVADDPALWSPKALTPALACTEGWTFGVP